MRLNINPGKFGAALLLALAFSGCNHSAVKEPSITGKSRDGTVAMQAAWPMGNRLIYRVETVTSSDVPRKNTAKIIHAEFTLGQDLAFSVTNTAPDGSRILQMEILSVQMENARDDGVTLSFDSNNKVMQVEDNELVNRLKKLVGLKLQFHLSPSNKVMRVDGAKELNNRASGGGGPVRGLAGSVVNRHFNPQFYKEIVEMGMLPKNPVKVGDAWTVARDGGGGALPGGSGVMEVTATFRGWQRHDGTNCARIDFSGKARPGATEQTNQSFVGRVVASAVSPNVTEGFLTGRSWFDPGLSLVVETIYDQSITTKANPGRATKTTRSTNDVTTGQSEALTNAPPGTNPPPPNVVNVSNATTTTRQHTSVKLLEVEPIEK